MPWQWEIDNKRYRDTDTGRWLSAATVRDLVTERARVSGAATDSFAEMLQGGQLNTRDWETGMRAQIKAEYVQQYLLGKGGLSQMTPQDWGSVGGMLADQYRYLGGFAREIASGQLSEAQVAARSKMYINSGREAFERAQRRVETDADEVLWGLGAADHCEDCVGFAALGWQPIEPWPFVKDGRDAIPGSGDTICLTNCKCALEYRIEPEELPEETPPAGAAITFTDQESADEFLKTDSGINPELTESENEALGEYKGDNFFEINSDLRDAGYSEAFQDEIDEIDAALTKTSMRQPLIAYRGADWDVFDEDENFTGDVIQDDAFVSTSLMERTAMNFADGVMLEIRVPTGARALNMEQWSTAAGTSESELLLPRESRFRVISDNIDDDPDIRRLIVELML